MMEAARRRVELIMTTMWDGGECRWEEEGRRDAHGVAHGRRRHDMKRHGLHLHVGMTTHECLSHVGRWEFGQPSTAQMEGSDRFFLLGYGVERATG